MGGRLRTSLRAFLLGTALFIHFPEPAAADPITLAVAATVSSVVGAGGVGAFTFGFAGFSFAAGWSSIFASIAVRSALGFALNALTSKGGKARGGYKINELGAALPHQIVYGETRLGGVIFYQTLTDKGTPPSEETNEYYHMCIAFAAHEIEQFTTIYIDDEAATIDANGNVTAPSRWAGNIRIKEHLGSPDQQADPDMVSEIAEWTSDHRARGIAYLYCRFDYSSDFVNGVPTITALVKGRKVYDPREADHDPADPSTWAWSENPALCVRDYLMADFGLEESSDLIDDTAVAAAADDCDEELTSPTRTRYTCNGAFLLDSSPESIVRSLLSSMGGLLYFTNGKWGMQAAVAPTTVCELNEDDLRGSLRISTRQSRRDTYNTVTGVYRGAATEYVEADYGEVTDETYRDEDGGVRIATDLPLIFTDTEEMAQRLAQIALQKHRKQITVTGRWGLKALQLRVGDRVTVTDEYAGFSSKLFEVVDWKFSLSDQMDIQIAMILREDGTTVYNTA